MELVINRAQTPPRQRFGSSSGSNSSPPPSPPMAIKTEGLSQSSRGQERGSLNDLKAFAQDSLRNSPINSPRTLRNTGCLKMAINSSPVLSTKRFTTSIELPVLDELRSCQNCLSKFYANRTNTEAGGYFCSGECMWTQIMKGD